jgi:hypothetical protein
VLLSPQSTQSQNLSLRLLRRAATIGAIHVPSTMVASCSVASAACATISVCGRGADSSTSADRSSSPAAALGSSPSQDRSVDFLHNTTPMIRQARLSIYMNYSEIGYTHKLDWNWACVARGCRAPFSTRSRLSRRYGRNSASTMPLSTPHRLRRCGSSGPVVLAL